MADGQRSTHRVEGKAVATDDFAGAGSAGRGQGFLQLQQPGSCRLIAGDRQQGKLRLCECRAGRINGSKLFFYLFPVFRSDLLRIRQGIYQSLVWTGGAGEAPLPVLPGRVVPAQAARANGRGNLRLSRGLSRGGPEGKQQRAAKKKATDF